MIFPSLISASVIWGRSTGRERCPVSGGFLRTNKGDRIERASVAHSCWLSGSAPNCVWRVILNRAGSRWRPRRNHYKTRRDGPLWRYHGSPPPVSHPLGVRVSACRPSLPSPSPLCTPYATHARYKWRIEINRSASN